MLRTSKKATDSSEYALSQEYYDLSTPKVPGGIFFIDLIKNGDKFTIKEQKAKNSFLTHLTIDAFVEIKPDIFLCMISKSGLVIQFERAQKKHKNVSVGLGKDFNCIQKVHGYDEENFPFIIVKDNTGLYMMNIKTLQAKKILDCPYDGYAY